MNAECFCGDDDLRNDDLIKPTACRRLHEILDKLLNIICCMRLKFHALYYC